MRAGLAQAKKIGVEVLDGESIGAFGDGWIISDKAGFTPCPWAFQVARFCPVRPGDRILDLGTGSGVLLLALKQIHSECGPMVGIELDTRTTEQANRNFRLAELERCVAVAGDIREPPVKPAFNLVVSNPPFYPPGWGRVSDNQRTAQSTHAQNGDITDFLRAAIRHLLPSGQVVFIFDGSRVHELLVACGEVGLAIKEMRFLDDDRQLPARVLIRGSADGSGLMVERLSHR